MALTLGVIFSIAACGGGGGNTGDGGNNNNDGGTNNGAACQQLATAFCTKFSTCFPNTFQQSIGTVEYCTTTTTASCSDSLSLPGSGGFVNPSGCASSIMGGTCADLETFLFYGSAACMQSPGTVAAGQPCGSATQCAAGLTCTNSGSDPARCMTGMCTPTLAAGAVCNGATGGTCDSRAQQFCVHTFNPTAGTTSTDATCQSVTFVAAGADCSDGSNLVCNPGLHCNASHKCVAEVALNGACDNTDLICDGLQELTCTNNTCQSPALVAIGAQCGLVGSSYRYCHADAFCNSATPTVCEARKAMGQPCTATPDNCALGLECASSGTNIGTCQMPAAPTCPGPDGLAQTSGSLTSTDPSNTAVTRGANDHVDSFDVPMNLNRQYAYQLCPVHSGWDPVATLVGPTGSADNTYCDSGGTGTAEECTTYASTMGTYKLYVSDYSGGPTAGDTIDRSYTVAVKRVSLGALDPCPTPLP